MKRAMMSAALQGCSAEDRTQYLMIFQHGQEVLTGALRMQVQG
jgi:hypothetical protein